MEAEAEAIGVEAEVVENNRFHILGIKNGTREGNTPSYG